MTIQQTNRVWIVFLPIFRLINIYRVTKLVHFNGLLVRQSTHYLTTFKILPHIKGRWLLHTLCLIYFTQYQICKSNWLHWLLIYTSLYSIVLAPDSTIL